MEGLDYGIKSGPIEQCQTHIYPCDIHKKLQLSNCRASPSPSRKSLVTRSALITSYIFFLSC